MARPALTPPPSGAFFRRSITQRLYVALATRLGRIALFGRILRAQLRGVTIDHSSVVEPYAQFRFTASPLRPGTIVVAPQGSIGSGAILDSFGGDIRIGENCFIGPFSIVMGHGGVTIGRDTLVAAHCRILSSEHQLSPLGVAIKSVGDIVKTTVIGDDCWLGAGVTVKAGVTIGDGCVVGAGAVVTRDLAPGSIAVGVPARVIGSRTGTVVEIVE